MSDDGNNDDRSPTESNGWKRRSNGTFGKGNRGGPGNPHQQRAYDLANRLDAALQKAFTEEEIIEMWKKMGELALAGDTTAFRIICERHAGPPRDRTLEDRLESLEALVDRAS